MADGISRRDILRNLAIGAAGGSVLQMIPAQAAELAHDLIQKEKNGVGREVHAEVFPGTPVSNVVGSLRCDYSQG